MSIFQFYDYNYVIALHCTTVLRAMCEISVERAMSQSKLEGDPPPPSPTYARMKQVSYRDLFSCQKIVRNQVGPEAMRHERESERGDWVELKIIAFIDSLLETNYISWSWTTENYGMWIRELYPPLVSLLLLFRRSLHSPTILALFSLI